MLFFRSPFRFAIIILVILLLLSATMGVSIGPVFIRAKEVWSVAGYKIGLLNRGEWTVAVENIVWLIRFPRVILAMVVGGGLAIVGVTLQALIRNPLADSYVLGISSGASVGAVLAIGLGLFSFGGFWSVQLAGFIGAIVAFLLTYSLANVSGKLTSERLVLSGIGVGYLFSGIASFITLTSSNRELAGQVLSWTLGSLSRASWFDLKTPSLLMVIVSLFLGLQARNLNALVLGDEQAISLGIEVQKFRRLLFVLVSVLTGVLVSVSGTIGFIGLIIPHMVRFIVRSDHRKVLPISALIGSIFLVWVDVIARTAYAPTELPVGVITSILGGPFFLYMLWRMRKRYRGGF